MPAQVTTTAVLAAAVASSLAALFFVHWRGRGAMPLTWLPTAHFVPVHAPTTAARGGVQRWWLLALRAALVATTALAAWQALRVPTPNDVALLKNEAPSPASSGQLAIVLDASLSMQQRCGEVTAFALAQRQAGEAIGQALAQGDEVGLWVATRRGAAVPAVALTRDREALFASVRATSASTMVATLAEAVRGAEAALWPPSQASGAAAAPPDLRRRCLVLYDGARHALTADDRARTRCALHDVRPAPGAAAINDVVVALQPRWSTSLEEGASAEVRVRRLPPRGRAGPLSTAPMPPRGLRLYLNGALVQRTTVAIAPDADATWTVRWPADAQGGLLRAELDAIADDVLRADDARTAWLPPFGTAVLPALHSLAQHHEDPLDYVARALALPPSGTPPTQLLSVGGLAQAAALMAAPAWLVADVRGAGPALQQLQQAPGAPRSVWQALGPNAADANAGAKDLVLGRLRDAREPTWAPPGGRGLGQIAWDHPILRDFAATSRASLMGMRVYAYWQLEPLPASDVVVVGLDDGSPLLVARQAGDGRGRRLLWTSTLSPAWTDFPLRAAYVPLMQRMAGWISGESVDRRTSFDAGQNGAPAGIAAGGASAQEPQPQGLQWLSPSGAVVGQGQSGVLAQAAFEEIGHYRAQLYSGAKLQPAPNFDVLVQAPQPESDLVAEQAAAELALASTSATAAPRAPLRSSDEMPYLLLVLSAFLVALDSVVASSSPKNAARVGVVP